MESQEKATLNTSADKTSKENDNQKLMHEWYQLQLLKSFLEYYTFTDKRLLKPMRELNKVAEEVLDDVNYELLKDYRGFDGRPLVERISNGRQNSI